MAPPKPLPTPSAAAVSPRRGKFFAPPASSSLSAPAAVPVASAAAAPSISVTEHDSRKSLRAHVHNSKIAAVSRRKAIARERDAVFNHLNEAENIVLSLLECASGVAGALSEMTTAKSKKRQGEKKVADANDNKDDDDGNNADEESFEKLTAQVRSSGVGYLAGVKKLHGLLAPHASLVKSYKNHDREGTSSSSSEGTPKSHKSLAAALPRSAAGATNDISSKIVEEATSNMYAARVKKRLAKERSEILSEMIRLEEAEGGSGNQTEKMNIDEDTAGSKRKHVSIQQTR